jgi:hypothetical protein
LPNKNIYFPQKSHHGYFDKALGQHFNTKTEKREFMNKHGIAEDGSMESDKHRTNRLVEEINHQREKQGLKPKTKEELIGDSRETREWKFR